ncbi:MAG: hypothetical protein R6U04_07470 [Bacteroidales bacterium]
MVRNKIEDLTASVFSMLKDYFAKQGFENPYIESMIFAALLDGVGFHFIMEPEKYPIEKIKSTLIDRYVKFFKNHKNATA